jgi:hypothetical protein
MKRKIYTLKILKNIIIYMDYYYKHVKSHRIIYSEITIKIIKSNRSNNYAEKIATCFIFIDGRGKYCKPNYVQDPDSFGYRLRLIENISNRS